MRKTLRSGPIGTAPPPPLESAAKPIGIEVPSTARDLEAELAKLEGLSFDDLRLQAEAFGDLDRKTIRMLERLADDAPHKSVGNGPATPRSDGHAESEVSSARAAYEPLNLKPGALLIREWQGRLERVTVVDDGFAWNGATYGSLSATAFAITGTKWNGHRFFGVRRRHRILARRCEEDPSLKKSSCSVRSKADSRALEAGGSSSSASVTTDPVEMTS
jgi:hypothetical protein